MIRGCDRARTGAGFGVTADSLGIVVSAIRRLPTVFRLGCGWGIFLYFIEI